MAEDSNPYQPPEEDSATPDRSDRIAALRPADKIGIGIVIVLGALVAAADYAMMIAGGEGLFLIYTPAIVFFTVSFWACFAASRSAGIVVRILASLASALVVSPSCYVLLAMTCSSSMAMLGVGWQPDGPRRVLGGLITFSLILGIALLACLALVAIFARLTRPRPTSND